MDLRDVRLTPAQAFALGTVVGAFIITMVIVMADARGQSKAPTAVSDVAQHGPSEPPNPAAACREVFARQIPALKAARASLAQWKVHVDAMNQLVAGAITLDQARAFWNQTRVGAKQRLARYRAADASLSRMAARCPPDSTGSSATSSCRQAVAERGLALEAADIAAATWARHIRDMDMLRAGTMSATQATQMWLQSWHQGAEQLSSFHTAARHARGLHC